MIRLLAVLPMGVPGLVLGLGYIFFFNHPQNPLNMLYHTMSILVISTIIHYYTSSHLTAVTALKSIDNEFEAVSASLKVPLYKTFFRVTVPVCLPAILDIARYFFVNAMTTVSAVVFCIRRIQRWHRSLFSIWKKLAMLVRLLRWRV